MSITNLECPKCKNRIKSDKYDTQRVMLFDEPSVSDEYRILVCRRKGCNFKEMYKIIGENHGNQLTNTN